MAATITADLVARIEVLLELGLGYLAMSRSTPTLSGGELQRLRLATALRSGLFGVVYVLDEPSAGLHPADAEPLVTVLDRLKAAGNSLFVVEHDMDVVRRADWVVDVGPGAGSAGGRVLHSGPVEALRSVPESATRRFLFPADGDGGGRRAGPTGAHRLAAAVRRDPAQRPRPGRGRPARGPHRGDRRLRLGQVDPGQPGARRRRRAAPGHPPPARRLRRRGGHGRRGRSGRRPPARTVEATGLEAVDRLVQVDQKPIGRTPRSNLATYTGLFDGVRALFAATDEARARGWGAGRFSFNVKGGRCETCQGEGFVAVELLFLPGTYAPCPTCAGARYDPATLEVTYRGRSIADVLDMVVDEASAFFADVPAVGRSLRTLQDVGLGYLHLGQPATELSGGEAQRIKLASELQRARRGHTLYLLDEPTTGLHPADVEVLMAQLHGLVDAGNTVVVVEHDMGVVATADHVVDLGPGAGAEGGRVVAEGTPEQVAAVRTSRTAAYLSARLGTRAR